MAQYVEIEEITKNSIEYILEIKKANPYHGKDGRFTSGPGGGASAVGMGTGGPQTAGGVKSAIASTLKEAELKNKDLDHEVATIVDSNTGKAIFSKEGDRYGVSFNSSEIREISGQILTHNHPDEVIFSPMDVAMSYNLKTIRATNPNGTVYELSNMRNRMAVTAYRDHYMATRADSFKKIGVDAKTRDRDLTPSQRAESFKYISDRCDKWLADNASRYRYQYNKGRLE